MGKEGNGKEAINDTKERTTYAVDTQNRFEGLQEISQEISEEEEVWFSGEDNELSNLYTHNNCYAMCKIDVYGRKFPTSEHAFQFRAAQYHNDENRIKQILKAKTPRAAKKVNKNLKKSTKWLDEDMEKEMRTILEAKLQCCEGYKRRLLSTGSRALLEDTNDQTWGAKNRGRNLLGKLHMEMREKVPNKDSTPDIPLSTEENTDPRVPHKELQTPGQDHPSQGEKQAPTSNEDPPPANTHTNTEKTEILEDILIISDLLGKHLKPELMFRRDTHKKTQLTKGKNIKDARDYLSRVTIKSKTIMYIVGTNDLSHNRAVDVGKDLTELIDESKKLCPTATIFWYEIPARKKAELKWPGFESRRLQVNELVRQTYREDTRVAVIQSSLTEKDIWDDQIHIRYDAVRIMATDLRRALEGPRAGPNLTRQHIHTRRPRAPSYKQDNIHEPQQQNRWGAQQHSRSDKIRQPQIPLHRPELRAHRTYRDRQQPPAHTSGWSQDSFPSRRAQIPTRWARQEPVRAEEWSNQGPRNTQSMNNLVDWLVQGISQRFQ